MTCAVRLVVRCDGVTSILEPGESLHFGRQPANNDIVIGSARKEGSEDTLVSRLAGSIENRPGQIAIANTSTFEPFDIVAIEQPGRPRHAAVGDTLVMDTRDIDVRVPGQIRTYVLEVRLEQQVTGPAVATTAPPQYGIPPTEGPLTLSIERRLDLAALCAPLFDRPGSRAKAASYRQGAELRGISRKALEKRIEHLVDELRRSGAVGGLEQGGDVKQALCEHAMRTGSVTANDLDSLRGMQ
jgi:hypothetical protein